MLKYQNIQNKSRKSTVEKIIIIINFLFNDNKHLTKSCA